MVFIDGKAPDMKRQHLVVLVLLVLVGVGLFAYDRFSQPTGHFGTDSGLIPLSKLSGSQISETSQDVIIRFEAVVVNRGERCIELFTPDEFEKYNGDPKWAISSRLGFEPGLLDRLPGSGRAIVTGRYVFVRDVHDGPCGIVTGMLFEISEITYL